MKKVFGIFAMMLAIAACNKNEIDPPVENAGGIPFTATISIGDNMNTKALSEVSDGLLTSWAVGEKVALIYTVGTTTYVKEAEVTPQTDGTATISTTLDGSPADDTDVTIVYPASAVDATTKDVKTDLLASQNGLLTGDGSISKMYDLRKTTSPAKLKIDGTTASLKGSVSLTNQVAIFKFTVKNAAGTATIDVKPLTVTIGTQNYVITPATATSELYVALPAVSDQTVTFTATGSDSKTYTCSKASVSFDDGKYYQSTLKMALVAATGHALSASVVGDVVGTDGLAYDVADKDNLPTGVTAAGMVAYKSGSKGLVIALTDEADVKNWDTANGASGAAAHTPTVTGQAWKLPSQAEWNQMFSANGGSATSYTGLNTAITSAGGKALENGGWYWSSTEFGEGNYAYYVVLGTDASWDYDGESTAHLLVRACLRFDIALITSPAVGQVIGNDGKNYADAAAASAAGAPAVAKICYVGSDNGEAAPYNHGLALALTDEGQMNWFEAGPTCSGKNTSSPVDGALWILPSKIQLYTMGTAVGGYAALRDGMSLQSGSAATRYWTSASIDGDSAWSYLTDYGNGSADSKTIDTYWVRAGLVF